MTKEEKAKLKKVRYLFLSGLAILLEMEKPEELKEYVKKLDIDKASLKEIIEIVGK